MIICGYQGCGKTTYCKNHPETTIDLDSSMFIKRPQWEKDYVHLAVLLSSQHKQVFISAHKEVIQYLQQEGLDFQLLIPRRIRRLGAIDLNFDTTLTPRKET